MKNQNDMIFSICAGFVAVVAAVVFFFTKPVPVQPAAPAVAETARAPLPTAQVAMGNSLPGASASTPGAAGSLGGPGFKGVAPPASAGGGTSGPPGPGSPGRGISPGKKNLPAPPSMGR